MLMAAQQFSFILLLVLQIELTIAWNGSSGLQSLSTVGQLIPFIIGVGWLIKVVWSKWRLVSADRAEIWVEEGGEYERAMAIYVKKADLGEAACCSCLDSMNYDSIIYELVKRMRVRLVYIYGIRKLYWDEYEICIFDSKRPLQGLC